MSWSEPTKPILLIEDDEEVREIVAAVLEEQGYGTNAVANGREAIKWLADPRHSRPSVILLDLMMPLMNGYEFHAWLMKQPAALSTIPIVLFSADGNAAGKARELGVAGGLPKPASIASIVTAVRDFAGEPLSLEDGVQ